MPRTPERSIPAVAVPSLGELGLGHLAVVRRRTQFVFLARPVLAAGAAIALAATGHVLAAVVLAPCWYAWTLTLVHHSVHGSLGWPSWCRHLVLAAGGLAVLHSGHALLATHLQHHRSELDDDDPEGDIEQVTWAGLPTAAVAFRYRLWVWAVRHATGRRRLVVVAEVMASLAVTAAAVATIDRPLGQLLGALWACDVAFAVLAGKGPQTNWGRPVDSPLVIVRGRLARWAFCAHHWHLEHHLYPQVPMPSLGPIADRIEHLTAAHRTVTVVLP